MRGVEKGLPLNESKPQLLKQIFLFLDWRQVR